MPYGSNPHLCGAWRIKTVIDLASDEQIILTDSASFDRSLVSIWRHRSCGDLASSDEQIFPRQVLASFDHNPVHDLVTLGMNDQITMANSASFDRSITSNLVSLDTNEQITLADLASLDQSHRDSFASFDQSNIWTCHHRVRMGNRRITVGSQRDPTVQIGPRSHAPRDSLHARLFGSRVYHTPWLDLLHRVPRGTILAFHSKASIQRSPIAPGNDHRRQLCPAALLGAVHAD
ncbi:hypothetical protein V6N13_047377 [Hibiscus sabdariffa]